jgi:hypothetical protein
MSLFVLRFTEEGQRIFNVKEYLALDENGSFNTSPYFQKDEYFNFVNDLPEGSRVVQFDLPDPMVTESQLVFMDNSLFSHVSYRHELVLQTSLPMNNTVECDTNTSHYKRQLASYRFPESGLKISYTDTLYRRLKETRQTMYTFENTIKTHNVFKLHGTELQNFSLFLVNRNYTWDGNKYVQTEVPYDLHNDTFYTIQLAVKPLK